MSVSAHTLTYIDVGVQCDIALLSLLTSDSKSWSEEDDEISLPHHPTDHVDHKSESWGEVTEEPKEAEEDSEVEEDVLNQSTR